MIHLYGIPNCDTVKKARVWLDAQGREYAFHDYKKEGADPARLAAWIAAAGLDAVVNRKGTPAACPERCSTTCCCAIPIPLDFGSCNLEEVGEPSFFAGWAAGAGIGKNVDARFTALGSISSSSLSRSFASGNGQALK